MSEFDVRNRLEFDADRRKYGRAIIESTVALEVSGREYLLVSKDISAGGLSTLPHPEITPSSEGFATFAIGEAQRPISCRCRVIYSIDGRGIGVEFLDLSEESLLALKKFVDESN